MGVGRIGEAFRLVSMALTTTLSGLLIIALKIIVCVYL